MPVIQHNGSWYRLSAERVCDVAPREIHPYGPSGSESLLPPYEVRPRESEEQLATWQRIGDGMVHECGVHRNTSEAIRAAYAAVREANPAPGDA